MRLNQREHANQLSAKSASEQSDLTALKEELTQWRQSHNKSAQIPLSLRNKMVSLRLSGVSFSAFQALGVSHKQLTSWLEKISQSSPGSLPSFAQVQTQGLISEQSIASSIIPPQKTKGQSVPFKLQLEMHQMKLSVSCYALDDTKDLLKTFLENTHAAINTTP